MEGVLAKAAVERVRQALITCGAQGEITVLAETARSAADAAASLGVEVGQIASSIIFVLPDGAPLLVVTSGRHRVDTERVCRALGIGELGRADAAYIKEKTGFSIGGVSPVGWTARAGKILIDQALADFDVVWAAAGHPHAVFPTHFAELLEMTDGVAMVVGD